MPLEQNKALIVRFYQIFDQQDIDQGRGLMSPNIVGQGLDGSARTGIDAFIQYGMSVFTAFPDGQHQLDEIIAEGDKVFSRGTFSGTHQGPLMGIPPTGKHVKFSVVHVDRIENGQVIEHWGQADMFNLMQQLGAIPL